LWIPFRSIGFQLKYTVQRVQLKEAYASLLFSNSEYGGQFSCLEIHAKSSDEFST